MKIFLLLLFASVPALAKVPMVMAPSADAMAYQRALQSSPGFESYISSEVDQMQKSEQLDASLLSLGDNLDKPLPALEAQLHQLHQSQPWSAVNAQFLNDLWTKINETPLDPQDKKTAEKSLCTAEFLSDHPLSAFCVLEKTELKNLRQHFPEFELLMIDAKPVALQSDLFLDLPTDEMFHWTLLSNKSKPWHFFGTYRQLLLQTAEVEPLIQGSCESHSLTVNDFTLESTGFVFFDSQCIKALHQEPPETGFVPWLKENKNWLIPVGIVLGGLAAYQLRNNMIVIDSPFK